MGGINHVRTSITPLAQLGQGDLMAILRERERQMIKIFVVYCCCTNLIQYPKTNFTISPNENS